MTAKKHFTEFELPGVVIGAVSEYIGPAALAKLTAKQRTELADEAHHTAKRIGAILEPPENAPTT
jgi:hypothetical protein